LIYNLLNRLKYYNLLDIHYNMEPVSTTIIYSTLTWFIGYYVGADFYNYYKSRQAFDELKSKLDEVTYKLDRINCKLA